MEDNKEPVSYLNLQRDKPRIPICGEDFCEECGDCLHCYDGECVDDGSHNSYVLWYDRDEDGELLDKWHDKYIHQTLHA